MNKNQYRIIFNKARGMMMVVAETVTSHGSSGNTTKNRSVDPDDSGIQAQWLALPKPITLTRFSSACVLMIGAAFSASLAQAQIIADPTAPKNQQPTVLNTANGLPQVNIQTPTAQGVSVNTYNLFNVDKSGAILNNSRTDTSTQTAGWIQGNPWLANGSAKIILNQVNSSNPSLLNGYIEVAGQRAQVIVANPSGISCDGCGFINTSRATLTTGIPVLNGGNLDSYRVQRGTISIKGAGLDTSNADYTDLIAHAVQVNAGVWAKQLNVITGANQVSADNTLTGQNIPITKIAATETAPQYGIDVAQLGGMYAGKITLIGTEAGVGVRSAGTIGASAGDLVITSDGNLENSGKIGSQGDSQLQLKGGLTNSGNITSLQNLTLTSGGNINNSGALSSQQAATITTSSDLSNSGTIYSGGQLNLASSTAPANTISNSTGGSIHSDTGIDLHSNQLNNQGTLQTNGLATLSVQNDIDNSHGTINVQRLVMTSSHGNLNNAQGVISQTGNSANDIGLDITGAALSNQKGGVVGQAPITANSGGTGASDGSSGAGSNTSGGSGGTTPSQPVTPPTPLANGILNIAGNITNDAGSILTPGSANLSVFSLNNTSGFMKLGNTSVSGAQLINDQGKLNVTGNLTATTANLSNQGGSILVANTLTTQNQNINNAGGTLQAKNLNLSASQTLNNANGTITQTGKGSASIIVGGELSNDHATIQSAGDLSLTAGSITGSGSTLTTEGNLNIASGATSLNTATVNVAGNAILHTAALDTRNAQITTNQDLTIHATSLDNSSGSITAVHNATIQTTALDNATTESLNNHSGTIQAGNALAIIANDTLDNTSGTLAATGTSSQLTISANQLNNTSGTLLQKGVADTTLNVTNDLNNDGSGSAGLIETAGNLNINAGSISGTQGTITTLKNLNLTSGTTSFNSGNVTVQGDANLTTGAVDNTAGKIIVNGNLTANTTGDLTNTNGQITAVQNATIQTQGNVDNTSGLIQSGQVLSLNSSGAVTNNLGTIEALGSSSQLNIQAQSLDNASGVLRQTGTADTTINVTNNLNNGGKINSGSNEGEVPMMMAAFRSDAITNDSNPTNTYGFGLIETAGNLSINAGSISGTQGVITTLKNLNLTSGTTSFNSGTVTVQGDANLTTGTLDNTSGHILVNGILTANTGDLTNTNGQITAVQNTTIQTQGNVDNTSGLIQSGQVLTLNSSGAVTNNLGTIEALGTSSQLNIQAQSLDNANGILRQTGAADTTINVTNNLNNGGTASSSQNQNGCDGECYVSDAVVGTTSPGLIETAGNLSIDAGSISGTQGTITTLKNLNLTSGTTSFNSGMVSVQDDAHLTTGALDNTSGKILVNGNLTANITGDLSNHQGKITALQNATIQTQGNIDNTSGQIQSGQVLTLNSTGAVNNTNNGIIEALGPNSQLKLQAQSLDNGNGILRQTGTADTTIDVINNLNNGGTPATWIPSGNDGFVMGPGITSPGLIETAGNLNINAGSISGTQGTITTLQNLDLTSGITSFNSGKVNVQGDAHLTTDALDNTSGQIIVNGSLIANTTGDLSNHQGEITAQQNATIQTQGNLDDTSGLIQSGQVLTVKSSGAVTNNLGTIEALGSTSQLTLQAQSLDNTKGSLLQTGTADTTVNVTADLNNTQGAIQTAGNLGLTTGSLSGTQGTLTTLKNLNLTSGSTSLNTGTVNVQGDAILNTAALDNTAGKVLVNGALSINGSGDVTNTQGILSASNSLQITSQGNLNNHQGQITSNTSNVTASVAQNIDNGVDAGSAGLITAATSVNLQGNNINNSGTVYAGTDTTVNAVNTITNSSTGTIAALNNTTLTATGAGIALGGTINSSGTFAAGLNKDGTLSATSNGNLSFSAQTIKDSGLNLAPQNITGSGGSVSLADSQTNAKNISLTATSGDIDLNHATITAANTFSATANTNATQTLNNDSGHLTANTLVIQASNLSNISGQMEQKGNSDLTMAARTASGTTGTMNNSNGQISTASQNLTLIAHDLRNDQVGKIKHTGTGTLTINADQLEGSSGQIETAGALNLTVTGNADLSSGITTVANQLTLNAGSLTNKAGHITQSGSAATQINVTGGLDNRTGDIGSNGNMTMNVGSLNNQAGSIKAAGINGTTSNLTLTSAGLIDNRNAGKILSSGTTNLTASSLNNDHGILNASQNLAATISGDVSNTAGNLGALGNVNLTAKTLENSQGLLASQNGSLTLGTSGITNNSNGTIGAATSATLTNHGLINNTQGKIGADALSINTQGGTLDNSSGGQLSGANALHIDSGALNNDTGLIQTTATNSTLGIDTHGQLLTNTNSGSTAGISSQGTLTLTTGGLNNQSGFIGATQDLNATSGNITNTQGGQISSSTNVHLTGTGLNNIGGKVQTATGDVTLMMGNGIVNNTGSLIQAGQASGTTSITAGNVINDQTSGSQGIQGKDVLINTGTLSNQSGHILASQNNGNITITASQTVNNQAGIISAGQDITVQDASPNNKSLVVTNTNGTMIADHDLTVNAHSATLDGSLLALHNLTLTTDTDLNFTNSGTTNAANTANISTHGNVTNSADSTHLSAGNTLSVTAVNINNTAQGTFNSGNTILNAQQTVTNRGLINSSASAAGSSGETYITGNTINNLGTGRIYGDHVAIGAQTLNNTPENGTAPVIASRNNMDLGVQVLNNNPNVNPNAILTANNGSKILSLGDLNIGGSLDNSHIVTGQAQRVINLSSTIESQGNMNINTASLLNKDVYFAYAPGIDSTTVKDYWTLNSSTFYQEDYGSTFGGGVSQAQVNLGQLSGSGQGIIYVYDRGQGSINTVLNNTGVQLWSNYGDSSRANIRYAVYTKDGVTYQADNYTEYRITQTTIRDQLTSSDPAQILVGGDLNLFGNTFTTNQDSQMIVGGNLIANLNNLNNIATQGTTTIHGVGSDDNYYVNRRSCCHDRTLTTGWLAFNPADIVQTNTPIVGGLTPQQQVQRNTNYHPTGSVVGGTATTGFNQTLSNTNGSTGGANAKQTVDTQASITNSTIAQGQEVDTNSPQISSNIGGIVNTGTSHSANAPIKGSNLNASDLNITLTDALNNANAQVNGSNLTPIHSTVNTSDTAQGTSSQVTGGNVQSASATVQSNQAGQVSTIVPSLKIPNNALYTSNPNNPTQPLVVTDPAFTNHNSWLSSDYMLHALSLDPNQIQKRLGDGFYEQQLIKQQVGQLTGRRFLDGYTSDASEYQALMDNGVTFAQAWGLTPGIALTSAQMAQLTSDIVWMVSQTITLPDGSTQTALVPQVYVRTNSTDLKGDGTLISANNITGKLTGDLTNTGTIAGRQVVSLTANNIDNLGGRIQGNQVGLTAKQDINNIGGTISADQKLILDAGHDVNVTTTTQSTTNKVGLSNYSQTNINRVAGLYVGNTTNPSADGLLSIHASNDIKLTAADMSNQSTGGTTQLNAGNNVNLDTVTTAVQNNMVQDAKNYLKTGHSEDVGTQINSSGNLLINAKNQINAAAATLNSKDGTLQLTAKDININAGTATDNFATAHVTKSSGFLSHSTTTTADSMNHTTALGSSLGGQDLVIAANHDLTVTGAQIIGDNSTTLAAKNNVTIQNATNTSSESHYADEKKSGLLGASGNTIGFTIGKNQETNTNTTQSTTAAGSTIGSINGNVNVIAGNSYTQTGSSIQTPNGDTNITAKNITIQNAEDSSNSIQDRKTKQTGLTLAISNPLVSAAQSVKQMADAAGQTGSDRMKALAGASAALTGYNTANNLKSDPMGADGKLIGPKDANGNPTDGKSATQKATALSVSATIGGSQSHSHSEQDSTTATGSSITAGGNVNLTATGGGANSNINIIGSDITAGKNANLIADNQINILSAQNTSTQQSKNTSSSGGVGVAATQGQGIGVTANASVGRGHADGTDVTQVNSHINAKNTADLISGGDTNIKGGVVNAHTISANVGGNLNIESLQDTSTYKSDQQNVSGSVTVGAGAGGSASYSQSNIKSNYASVTEQSGLKAGDGGFNVNVNGNTDLKGAVISSTQGAIDQGNNSFTTQKLTTSDIQNHADYSATSVSVSGGTGGSAGASAGYGNDSGHASSVTQAGISGIAGNSKARTGDAETGIANNFNAAKVQKEIDAQTQITQAFSQQAPKAVATYSENKIADLKNQLKSTNDPAQQAALQTEITNWSEGGTYRVALHTVAGAMSGGVAGAVGAGVVASQAQNLNQLQSNTVEKLVEAGLSPKAAILASQGLFEITAAGIGAVASGGSVQGAGSALTTDANNRQLHATEISMLQKKAAQLAKSTGKDENYWFSLLYSTAYAAVDSQGNAALNKMVQQWNASSPNGADGDLGALIFDKDRAARVVASMAGQTITADNGNPIMANGSPVKTFQATSAQYTNNQLFGYSPNKYGLGLPDLKNDPAGNGVSGVGNETSQQNVKNFQQNEVQKLKDASQGLKDPSDDVMALYLTDGVGKVITGIAAKGAINVVDQSATGISWGKGIQGQGMPWEDYLAAEMPAGSRLPPNFKTFDYFDDKTGLAVSAKTLDTTTTAKVANPSQVYQSIKTNVDAAANFTHYELSGLPLDESQITTREIQLAIPQATTPAQWEQISKAIQYGQSKGVTIKVTEIK